MISELPSRLAIVTTIQAKVPDATVARRYRYPMQGQEADYLKLYTGQSEFIHYYGVRRLRAIPTVQGIQPRLIKIDYTFGIRAYRSLLDNDDDTLASEELFQAELDTVMDAFNTSPFDLGLGKTVETSGLQMATDFVDVYFGDYRCHRVDLRIDVTVANVTC